MSDAREKLEALRNWCTRQAAFADEAKEVKRREEMSTQATSKIRDIREETAELMGKRDGFLEAAEHIDEVLRWLDRAQV